MKIYNYDHFTNEYCGTDIAEVSPLEPGKYLIPAFSTEISPPPISENQVPIFNSGKWVIAADWRNTTLYRMADGSRASIEQIGITPESQGLTPIAPNIVAPCKFVEDAWVPDTEKLRESKLSEIYNAYQQAITKNVSYLGSQFQADASSQDILSKSLASCISQGATPDGFYWIDANNNRVTMTLAQLQGLASAMFSQGWTAFKHYQDLKSKVLSATTADEIIVIQW